MKGRPEPAVGDAPTTPTVAEAMTSSKLGNLYLFGPANFAVADGTAAPWVYVPPTRLPPGTYLNAGASRLGGSVGAAFAVAITGAV